METDKHKYCRKSPKNRILSHSSVKKTFVDLIKIKKCLFCERSYEEDGLTSYRLNQQYLENHMFNKELASKMCKELSKLPSKINKNNPIRKWAKMQLLGWIYKKLCHVKKSQSKDYILYLSYMWVYVNIQVTYTYICK